MKAWITLALVGCSSARATIPAARFANAPPVTVVDDRRDVPVVPVRSKFQVGLYNLRGQIIAPISRVFGFGSPSRALGTSSIDEVPDSTWFTNRIGVREVTPDELRVDDRENPEHYRPWTIHSTKVGGMSVGFIVSDTRGRRFVIKFDDRGFPEAETAAHMISAKLLWACGYNVTDDHIAYIRRSDLVIAKDAIIEDTNGKKRRLDRAAVDRKLSDVEIGADGQIRTMASRMLDGKPLGAHAGKGTRADDPNDRIPHERRRDLRGAHSIFAWLDHDDIQQSQMIDMWVADRADPRRHYVKHYFLDFGNTLGVMALSSGNLRRSYEYVIDIPVSVRSLLTLGFWPRHWAKRSAPSYRGLGVFETDAFAPGTWKPTTPVYTPLAVADQFDKFWGAKIVMRFTREQLRAAIEAGRLTDPRTKAYLTEALIARQRATGAYWFSRVNPLDNFTSTADGLCFDDLMLTYKLAPAGTVTSYSFELYDRNGRPIGRSTTLTASTSGRTCAAITPAGPGDGYTIVRVTTARPGFRGSTFVHLAREPETGAPRVIGIVRT